MDRFGLVVMAVQDDPVRSRNDDLALNPVVFRVPSEAVALRALNLWIMMKFVSMT